MPSVEEKVRQIVVDQLGVDPADVTLEASFTGDLGADDLDQTELIGAFETAFNLEIPGELAGNIHTVGQAIAYLEKNAKSVKQ
ncbi:MAG TPA: acyl carrier protein [Verrucomicrobiae bacterium]|jgi:acyl carrier protein|nr:acyl carrier protein [Verrucomicrobiae bacterium]